MKYVFFIPGKPKGKGRPRFGKGYTYTPERTVDYENLIQWSFLKAYPGRTTPVAERAVSVSIRAFFTIPKSTPKGKKAKMQNGEIAHTKKPDLDNIIKAVLDALNGLIYADDKQITEIKATKGYAYTHDDEGILVEVVFL